VERRKTYCDSNVLAGANVNFNFHYRLSEAHAV